MATGSGKTITALSLTTELYKKIGLQVLLVVCPYRHLVSQWARECQKFGLEPILAFENVRIWQSKLSTQLYNIRSGNQPFLTIITTNATFMSQGLQSLLPYLPEKTLIVGDDGRWTFLPSSQMPEDVITRILPKGRFIRWSGRARMSLNTLRLLRW